MAIENTDIDINMTNMDRKCRPNQTKQLNNKYQNSIRFFKINKIDDVSTLI